jgi:hypothetical protein
VLGVEEPDEEGYEVAFLDWLGVDGGRVLLGCLDRGLIDVDDFGAGLGGEEPDGEGYEVSFLDWVFGDRALLRSRSLDVLVLILILY